MGDRPLLEGVEQFGSKEPGVRIGGSYALERLAHNSPLDHPTIHGSPYRVHPRALP